MISLRLNTLKGSHEEILAQLQSTFPHADLREVEWYKDALLVLGVERETLLESALVREGYCYAQSLSSMLPAVVLAAEPGERVLDMCAAPGSKTTQIAAMMENSGEIIANDSSRTRLFKLKNILQRYGVANTQTNCARGEQLYRRFPDTFDRVLVDVPCSMNQPYAPKRLRWLSSLQKKLLRSALSTAKVGGVVVYSTCTGTQEENEAVVRYLLSRDERAALEPIRIDGIDPKFYTEEGMLRIEESEGYDSFFVARLRRNT